MLRIQKKRKTGFENASWTKISTHLFRNEDWWECGILVISNNSDTLNNLAKKDTITFSPHRVLSVRSLPVTMFGSKIESSSLSTQKNNENTKDAWLDSKIDVAFCFFARLSKYLQLRGQKSSVTVNMEIVLIDEKQQEVFMPIIVADKEGKSVIFYISPGVSSPTLNSNFSNSFSVFPGINKVVTAGCLFGTALQAIDTKNALFTMIQHKIPFVEGDKIVGIMLDEDFSPYELAQFSFLEDMCFIIKQLEDSSSKKKLLYHLPDVDYILSMIKLFIHNKIDYEVLEEFRLAVKTRALMHIDVITKIFAGLNIKIKIESPFKNLLKYFGEINHIDDILKLLDISVQDKPFCSSKKLEQAVVRKILNFLIASENASKHQLVWSDMLMVSVKKDRIHNFETLFKTANAAMIAIAAKGSQKNSVCSILPSSEKPIFIKYLKCTELFLDKKIAYPDVLSLVVLERLVCYSRFAVGNSFYFRPYEMELNQYLQKGVLQEACQKFGFFSTGCLKPRDKMQDKSNLLGVESALVEGELKQDKESTPNYPLKLANSVQQRSPNE
jgi:hypothetical protein